MAWNEIPLLCSLQVTCSLLDVAQNGSTAVRAVGESSVPFPIIHRAAASSRRL